MNGDTLVTIAGLMVCLAIAIWMGYKMQYGTGNIGK